MMSFMAGTIQIEVKRLKPELLEDYLKFFDRAFSDFPEWAGCYCGFYETPGASWDSSMSAGPVNRAAKSERIRAGKVNGLLAYVDGEPVGWCNAQPRANYLNMRSYRSAVTDPEEPVGSIMCFLVAPEHRKKGVSTALLNAACETFHQAGLEIAEGYPTTTHQRFGNVPWPEANYKGPLNLFLKNGFAIHRQLERFAIVRKSL